MRDVNKPSISRDLNQHHQCRKEITFVLGRCRILSVRLAAASRLPSGIIRATDTNCQRTIVWEKIGHAPDFLHT